MSSESPNEITNKWQSYLETLEMENLSSLLKVTRMEGELSSDFADWSNQSSLSPHTIFSLVNLKKLFGKQHLKQKRPMQGSSVYS